jgi:RNA recognition motif-containing protein
VGGERGRKNDGKPRGYVHRLDKVATSFFFTNFPEEVKAVDLWPKFARFGRVGEVYIPDKRDKQGRRFGFVKYRDVSDAREQLDLVSNIWLGSFKLRVNLSRFAKGAPTKNVDEEKERPTGKKTPDKEGGDLVVTEGRSFKEVLQDRPVLQRPGKEPVMVDDAVAGSSEVVLKWKLNGMLWLSLRVLLWGSFRRIEIVEVSSIIS